jgi:hypothetical protein
LAKLTPARADNKASFDSTPRMAKRQFIDKLLELYERKIPDNPIQKLQTDVWPNWHKLTHDPRPRGWRGMCLKRDLHKEAWQLLSRWAVEFSLIEVIDANEYRAVEWLVIFAQLLCTDWSRGELKLKAPPTNRWRRLEDSSEILEAEQTRQDALIIPMDCPTRRQGETWKQFGIRAARALREHLFVLQNSSDLATPSPFKPKSRGYKTPRERQFDPNHFEWLILYQCCKWPLAKIYDHMPVKVGTPDGRAIYQALKDKSLRLGLLLRRSRNGSESRVFAASNQRDFLE